MGKAYELSEKKLAEQYEDLLFKKVMAVYAEKESERINSETKEGDSGEKKPDFEKILKKSKKKKDMVFIISGLKKLAAFAAAVIFVAMVSITSVIVVPAEMQKSIREFFAPANYNITDNSVDIFTEESGEFIDSEVYTIENAYIPTWLPEGYELQKSESSKRILHVRYLNGDKEILILEYVYSESMNYHMDYDAGDTVENIIINGSEGVLIVKENGAESAIFLRCGETDFFVYADEPRDVTIKIAENMKKFSLSGNADKNESSYSIIEGALVPVWIPKNFYVKSVKTEGEYIEMEYRFEDNFFCIIESAEKPDLPFPEEKAKYHRRKKLSGFSGEIIGNTQYNCARFDTEDLRIMVYGNVDCKTIKKIANNMKPTE